MNKTYLIGGVIAVIIILVGGVFLVSKPEKSSTSTPTTSKYTWQKLPDLGRVHVDEGEKVKYNSNPPTSGSHYPVWETYGIKDKPVVDEKLVHSLEHGYIIMSYNCAKLPKNVNCDTFKKQIIDLANQKRTWKIIVIPRPELDVPVALTAWTYLDKMNSFDKERASAFIDEFRDHGPEQTME